MNHTISVIVPIYHGKHYIEGIIARLDRCAEKIPEFKLQLVLSNDAPEEVIENTYESSLISIKVLNTAYNRGIQGARVRGFENSNGDYILFLDQDDKLVPGYFASQLSRIGSADAVVCGAVSDDRIKYNEDRSLDKAASRECMIKEGNMILSPGQVLMRRSAVPLSWTQNILKNNGADDWLLWLCMHGVKKKFAVNEEILFIRELHYHNASFDDRKMDLSEREVINILDKEKLLEKREIECLRELLPELQSRRAEENQKWKSMFLLQNDWFRMSVQDISIARELRENNMERIAVYGYGYLGKALLEDLKRDGLKVNCIIDKNAAFLHTNIKCVDIDALQEELDAVIITIMSGSRKKIEGRLREKSGAAILWLEDIVGRLSGRERN